MNFGIFLPGGTSWIKNVPHLIGCINSWYPDLFGGRRAFYAQGPFSDEQFALSNVSPCTGVAYELVSVNGQNGYGTIISTAAANLQPAIKIPILKSGLQWPWWDIAPRARKGQFGNVVGFTWALQSSFTDAQLATILQIWSQNSPVGNKTWVTYA